MRKYIKPELDIVEFDSLDVITMSDPSSTSGEPTSTQDLVENDSPIAVHNEEQLVNSTSTADNTAPTTTPEASAEPTDTPLTTEAPAMDTPADHTEDAPAEETPVEEPATTDEVATQAVEADASSDIVE